MPNNTKQNFRRHKALPCASQICYDLILIPIPNIDKAVPCRYAINSKLEINVPNTFLVELKKQKITLSLHQQDEWEDYFTTSKPKSPKPTMK